MIEVRDIIVDLGKFKLGPISISVKEKEYVTLIGPNGSGKTTLLKTISGFYKPVKGKIILNSYDITRLPPEKRDIAYLPQTLSLFDNMSVKDNIAFGLRARRLPKNEIETRIKEIAEELGILELLDRKTTTLSGGQQQIVSLARALVIRPKLLLLDEPLSMIDVENRDKFVKLLKWIPKSYDIPVIHVTHNWEEVVGLSDWVYVINGGKLLEEGDVDEVFHRPKNIFTAKFTGFENIFDSEIVDNGKTAVIGNGLRLILPKPLQRSRACICFRPENVIILNERRNENPYKNVFEGTVIDKIRTLLGVKLYIKLDDNVIVTAFSLHTNIDIGQRVFIEIPPKDLHVI